MTVRGLDNSIRFWLSDIVNTPRDTCWIKRAIENDARLKFGLLYFALLNSRWPTHFIQVQNFENFIVFNVVSIPTDVTKSKDTGIVKFI